MPKKEVGMGVSLFVFGVVTLLLSIGLLLGVLEHEIYLERVWPIFILGVLTVIPYVQLFLSHAGFAIIFFNSSLRSSFLFHLIIFSSFFFFSSFLFFSGAFVMNIVLGVYFQKPGVTWNMLST